MTVEARSRSRWFLWLLLAVVASAVLAYLGFRAQARLASQLREQALGQGLLLEVGKAERAGLAVVFHDVRLRFRNAPGIRASLQRVTAHGALVGAPQVTIGEARFVLEGEPTTLYQSLLALPQWQGLPLTWQRVDVEYAQKLLGKLRLEDVRLERADGTFSIRAVEAKLGSVSSRNVVLSLDKRNELIEFGLGEPVGKVRPTQLGYFGSNRGISQWLLSARQQPARPLSQVFGWELGPSFDQARAVVSASLMVFDDRARATRANLELVLDLWPKPAWPDALALLGDTAAFSAHVEGPEQTSTWDLTHVSLSLSLFTLTGTGRVQWGEKPSLSLDLSGKLSCAQLRGNLPASVYLDQVTKYLAPEPALPASDAAARLREEVQLRLKLVADRASDGQREAAWHLDSGCGLAELASVSNPPSTP